MGNRGRSSLRHRRLHVLLIIATAAVMAVIFCFSSQTGPESQELSMGLVDRVMALLSIEKNSENLKLMNIFLRKLAHFTLYFVLGCCLSGELGGREGRWGRLLLVVLLGGAFAATDELHQSFTLRTASVRDVLLDTCGVAAGGLVFLGLRTWLAGRRGENAAEREERTNAESERDK